MKLKNLTLALFLFFANASELWSCSCETLYFCHYLNDDSVKIAFKAIVIDQKDYAGDNLAVYLRIIHKYKSEVQITDTIKLYGKEDEAGCDVDVRNFGLLGDTVILALGRLGNPYSPIVNPDSLVETYSEFRPKLCAMVKLRIKSGTVNGRIAENVFTYPLELFDEILLDCDFPLEEEVEFLCPASAEFKIFPNPSVSGWITIQSTHMYDSVSQIRVLAIDGRLISNFSNLTGNPAAPIKMEIAGNGLYILEFVCSNKRYYRKVIVTR